MPWAEVLVRASRVRHQEILLAPVRTSRKGIARVVNGLRLNAYPVITILIQTKLLSLGPLLPNPAQFLCGSLMHESSSLMIS